MPLHRERIKGRKSLQPFPSEAIDWTSAWTPRYRWKIATRPETQITHTRGGRQSLVSIVFLLGYGRQNHLLAGKWGIWRRVQIIWLPLGVPRRQEARERHKHIRFLLSICSVIYLFLYYNGFIYSYQDIDISVSLSQLSSISLFGSLIIISSVFSFSLSLSPFLFRVLYSSACLCTSYIQYCNW